MTKRLFHLSDYDRLKWDENLWHEVRGGFSSVTRLPERGSEDRFWLESQPTRAMLNEILSIQDGLERLVDLANPEVMEENPTLKNWITSIRGLQRRMSKTLEKIDVRCVPSLGRPFNMHVHEAVEVREEPGVPPATVVEVREKPYRWGGKVLRAGKVVVTPKPKRKSASQ